MLLYDNMYEDDDDDDDDDNNEEETNRHSTFNRNLEVQKPFAHVNHSKIVLQPDEEIVDINDPQSKTNIK
jgi:hypothetical protein